MGGRERDDKIARMIIIIMNIIVKILKTFQIIYRDVTGITAIFKDK